jgi:cyanophycinase-like exopeptidase
MDIWKPNRKKHLCDKVIDMVIVLEIDFKEIMRDKWSGFTWSMAGTSAGNTVINVGFVKCCQSDNL